MTVHVVDKVVLTGGGNAAPRPIDPQTIEQARMAAAMVQWVQARGAQIIARTVRNHLQERHADTIAHMARRQTLRQKLGC